jgi:hypothetical protein
MYGIERENVGTTAEPWRPDQTDAAARAHAALIRGKAGADMVCRHAEWTTRKIDTHSLAGDDLRAKVAHYLQGGGGTPTPDNPTPGDITMFVAIDSVALCCLVGNVCFTFPNLTQYGNAKNASPDVPALIIGNDVPIADRQWLHTQLIHQSITAVGKGDTLP